MTKILSFFAFLASCAVAIVSSQSCANQDADVLILGAGMSGIAAGHTLNANGVSKFLILEALPRIGGRVQQGEFPSGIKVELGAEWIHGLDPQQPQLHPLYNILQRCGVTLDGEISDYANITVYNSEGEVVNEIPRYYDYATAFEAAAETAQKRKMNNLLDISVRDGLIMNGWVPSSAEDNWVEWFSFDFCFAESPDISSLYQSTPKITYKDFGDPERTIDFLIADQRGYVQVVDCLADEFLEEQDPRLHLNANVSEVQWSNDCVCAKVVENGETTIYCASYAISTFSIGVLQSEELNRRFVPSLPQWKLDVINMFSMTNYLKFFAEFNTSFWDSNTQFIGHVSEQRGYFGFFQPLENGANVMVATLTESIADRLVRQPQDDSVDELVQALRGIYGSSVPEPVNVILPDWDINPLFLGTYANTPVGFTEETYAQLASPVGRLYFSGEATSAKYQGYVHGAYFAGIDSANAVIKSRTSAALKAGSFTSILCACLISYVCFSIQLL